MLTVLSNLSPNYRKTHLFILSPPLSKAEGVATLQSKNLLANVYYS